MKELLHHFARAAAALMLLLAFNSDAAEFKSIRISIDLNVEGQYVPSTIRLVVPLKLEPALGGLRENLDSLDVEAAAFVAAMGRGDQSYLNQRWERRTSSVPTAGAMASVSGESAEANLQSYLSAFRSFQDVAVLGRVPTDDGELILFRATISGKVSVRAFLAKMRSDRTTFSGLDSSARPVDAFIVNSFYDIYDEKRLQARMEKASSDAAVARTSLRAQLNSKEAYLEFEGKKLDAVVLPTIRDEMPMPIRVISARSLLLGSGQSEELAKMTSQASYRKISQWKNTMSEENFNNYSSAQAKSRQALFMMSAGAVSLVFYRNIGDIISHSAGPIAYDYVVQRDNKYFVSNVFYDSIFDEMIRGSSGFARTITSR